MDKKEEGDFVSKKFSYMIQAIEGQLPKEVVKSIGKLRTDKERFSFAWNLKEVHNVLELEKEFERKSQRLAKAHREKGNEYFQQKSYLTALGEYNISVIKAPRFGTSTKDKKSGDGDQQDKSTTNGTAVEQAADESAAESAKSKVELSSDNIIAVGEDEKKSSNKDSLTPQVEEEKAKNELALAFANRSAALFHLKRYRECLVDIQLAFESGYPEESQYKLYERQGSCYIELGNQTEAVANFTLAQESLPLANLDQPALKRWTQTLKKQLDKCKQLDLKPESENTRSKETSLPRISNGPSNSHPNASTTVRIQYNNIVGRHVVGGQEIKVGDVLVLDKPFAAVLFSRFHKCHCYHCFARVSLPIPCGLCTSVIYCSQQCRDASWEKFHQYECEFFALLDISMCAKIGHLAVRLLMVLGLNNALDFVRQREAEQNPPSLERVGMNSDGVYCLEYGSIYDMTTHSSNRSSEQIFDFSMVSCLLMKILQMSGYVSLSEDSPDFALLGSLLMRHLQIIQCNGLRIMEIEQPNRFDETRPAELGIGLYPTAALVNHSCDPTADLNFFGDAVVVRAIRNISQDEEITISYGPLFYETKELQRQSQLKAAYFFNCRCPACKDHWPVIEEMFDEVPRYKCGNCGAKLTTEERFERKFYKCSKCQYKQDMEEVVGQLQSSFDLFAKAMNDAMSGQSNDALPNFVQHLLLLQRYIQQPWRDFSSCQSAVKQCYRLQANKRPS